MGSTVSGRGRRGTRWLGLGLAAVLSTAGLAAVAAGSAASAATGEHAGPEGPADRRRGVRPHDGGLGVRADHRGRALHRGRRHRHGGCGDGDPAGAVQRHAPATTTASSSPTRPTDFAAGQLTALDTYESTFGVRQIDGYMFPDPALGATDVTRGALDGTTGTLTAAGLTAFPELAGPVPSTPAATAIRGHGVTPAAPLTRRLIDTTRPGLPWPGCTSTRAPTRRPGCRSCRCSSTTTPARRSGWCWRPG